MNPPWTHAELADLRARLRAEIADVEADEPDIRPLPAMTREEALLLLSTIGTAATTRPLTRAESAISGQLLCCFEHAVRAEMLGKRGRYFVVAESEIDRLVAEGRT